MSKFDKNPEERTVAKSPLQQSSFVFFPEEKKIRQKMLENPDAFLEGAKKALEDQQKKVKTEAAFLQVCFQAAERLAAELSALAGSFAQKLPQSVFGVGEGSEFLIPLDFLFENVRKCETGFDRLLLKLDPFWQPAIFDPARFALLESVVPEANVASEAKAVSEREEEIRRGARELSGRIGDFYEAVIKSFFAKAGEAADLEGDGKNMRFGRLRTLCGELQSAADQFAKTCKTEPQKLRIN